MSGDLAKHAAPLSVFTWAFLALGLVLFGLAGLGWSNHLSSEGELVANNVSYAGEPMEGADRSQVEFEVSERAAEVLAREITIDFGEGELSVALGEVGFSYDRPATVEANLGARHEGSVWRQFSSWALGGLDTHEVAEQWSFDRERSRAALDNHPGLTPIEVVEPRIEPDGRGRLVLIEGVVGTEADIAQIVEGLAAIELTDPPTRLEIEVEAIHPTVSDELAQERVDHLNDLTGDGVEISVNGKRAVVTAGSLQALLVIDVGEGAVGVRFDHAGLQTTLENTIVGPVGPFVEPTFEVEGDVVTVLTPGGPPPVCCAPGVGAWLGERILDGATGPFGLQSRPADDPDIVALSDGSLIVEKASEFTTAHACCETRVRNIQRMADLVRGVYLVPGETLSLNEFVGPRTVENGFFPAGAIRQGHLIQEVGGGVSQFATTIFNAAYFAGMDFEEYRSHTIYFSRYPYGREATISNPAPDLVMTNTTDYPILIWTSYTDESITVSMYSTSHIVVDEIDQRTSRRGACTHVETDRQRTYPDGRVVVDTFIADYRPAEGIDCNGNRIPPPPG
jgi:hypothetical protein